MDFIRLITKLSEHRKWMDTSGNAAKVLINLWCYCGRNETDGYVPAPIAKREGLTKRIAEELEGVGWLHRNGDGWHVHDWTEHQPTAEQMAEKRRKGRERVAEWRKQRGL